MDVLQFLANNTAALVLSAAVFGVMVGSFLNVLVYRLPVMLQRSWQSEARSILELPDEAQEPFNLVLPHSRCPHCEAPIRAWQNIPVVSWLLLRGRCASCKGAISTRYPLVELTSAVLSAVVAWKFGSSLQMVGMLVLTWGLLALSLIDADHQLLPDVLVLPLLWLGLLLNLQGEGLASLPDAVLGAALGYLSLWSVFWLFKLVTGKEGMGYGDFKLLAMLGAWGGWQILPLTIILSSVVGAVLGVIILRLQKQGMGQPLPFGPYLAVAGWIALIWGEQITRSYLQFAGF